eukprot:351336-Chlamydomonas_euryale.AAC.1
MYKPSIAAVNPCQTRSLAGSLMERGGCWALQRRVLRMYKVDRARLTLRSALRNAGGPEAEHRNLDGTILCDAQSPHLQFRR